MDTAAAVVLQSVVTCPQCGTARQETMPTDSCWFYYECSHCKTLLRPKAGECCVFCSYGSVKCPPVQAHGHCYLWRTRFQGSTKMCSPLEQTPPLPCGRKMECHLGRRIEKRGGR